MFHSPEFSTDALARIGIRSEWERFHTQGVRLRLPSDSVIEGMVLPMTSRVFNGLYSWEGKGFGICPEALNQIQQHPEYGVGQEVIAGIAQDQSAINQPLTLNGDRYDARACYITIEDGGVVRASLRFILDGRGGLDIEELMDYRLPPQTTVASEGRLVFNPSAPKETRQNDVLLINQAGLALATIYEAQIYVILASHVHRFITKAGVKTEKIPAQPRYGDTVALKVFLSWPGYWLPRIIDGAADAEPPGLYQVLP